MTAASRIKICIYCDKPIEGAALPVGQSGAWASTSGARDVNWRHVKGDTACNARRQ
jgi:hypothetical protein